MFSFRSPAIIQSTAFCIRKRVRMLKAKKVVLVFQK